MNPHRIGYILQTYPSLTEQFIAREIEALRRNGWDVRTFALRHDRHLAPDPRTVYYGGSALAREAGLLCVLRMLRSSSIGSCVKSLAPHYRRGTLAINVARALFILRRLNALGLAHVHCHFLTMPALLGYLTSRLSPTTYSLSGHAKDVFNPEFGQSPAVFEAADRIFFCNSAALTAFRKRFRDIPSAKLTLAHHGVELPDPSSATSPNRNGILAVGRLVKKKGFHCLLEAMTILRRQGLVPGLRIYGEGPMESELRAFIRNNSLGDQVLIHPFVPPKEMPTQFAAAAVLVQPSEATAEGDMDGIPNVILEAMALGTPVVAGRIPSLEDIFTHETDLLFAEPANPAALADAIRRALTDASLRKALADSARSKVARFFDPGTNVKPIEERFSRRTRARIEVLQGLEATQGGTRKHMRLLIDNLPRERFKVSLACSTLRTDRFMDDVAHYRSQGVPVHLVPMRRRIAPVSDLLCIATFSEILLDSRYEVIHLHSSKAGFVGRIAAWLCGYRNVLYSPHAFAFQAHDNPVTKGLFIWIERCLALITRKIVAVSQAELELTLEQGIVRENRDVVLAANALPEAVPQGREDRPIRTIGFLGRIERQKGCEALLRACAGLLQEHPRLRIEIGGDGSQAARLRILAAELGMEERVTFHGELEDPGEFYRGVDLLVMPSLWEASPYTLLEAIQAGVPFLASDIPPHVELLGRGSNRLFPARNVAALTTAIARALANPPSGPPLQPMPTLGAQMAALTRIYAETAALPPN